MFPSQRGNFFRSQGSTGSSDGGKGSHSNITLRRRPKSPPLGTSAVAYSHVTVTTTNHSPKSFREIEDDKAATLSILAGLPMEDVLPKFSRLSSRLRSKSPSRHFFSSLSPPATIQKTEYNPFLSKFDSSVNTPQILNRMPSIWSNQQWSQSDPFYKYNIRHGMFNLGSISTDSKAICHGKGGPCGELPPKTQQERLLVKKLCEDAMKRRRDIFAFYSNLHDEEMSQYEARLSNFDPKNHKGRLCDFMLKLVLERQQLLDERRHSFVLPRKPVFGDDEVENAGYTPVYCVRGKTILGKLSARVTFPNSFAPLTELHDPNEDPSGYLRFCTLVNMRGFKDTEIFLRVTGNCLTVDGVHLTKDEGKAPSGARVMSIYVDLPTGVYPEHLKIGRSTDGVLVIQEPWKF